MLESRAPPGPDPRRRHRRRPQPAGARRSRSASASRPTRRPASGRPPRRSSSDGESIVMDASTTALSVARQLKARGGWSQPDGHHQRPAARLGAGRSSRDQRADARRSRPLGGAVGRRPARRRPVPAGSTSRRRSSARPGSPIESGPGRRDRGRGPDQALHGRRGPRGHRDRRPHEMGARGVRHVLPDRPDRRRPARDDRGAARDGRATCIGRGIEVRLVGADRGDRRRRDGSRRDRGPAR